MSSLLLLMEVGAVKLHRVSSSSFQGPVSLVPAVPTTALSAAVSMPDQVYTFKKSIHVWIDICIASVSWLL